MQTDDQASRVGGVVLCGGQSRRMGRPKLALPFGDETLLQRVVGILSTVVDPVVVVRAPRQATPPLPEQVGLVSDDVAGRGPLAGIAAGLSALAPVADAAYVSSCDAPLLRGEFVAAIVARLGRHDMVVVRGDGYYHPLAAVYRTSLAGTIERLIADDRLRPVFLLDECDALVLEADELRDVDPGLESLQNVNSPDDYRRALRQAGFESSVGEEDV